jgi:WD40 repeat protein
MCSLTLQDNGSDIVWACKFSPKGDTIVSASQDRTLKIWDVALGTCKATLEGHRYLFLFPPLTGGEA